MSAILVLVSVDFLTYAMPGLTGPIFFVAYWGDCRKFPFDDECCRYTHHQSSPYSTSP
jgi:hypothetical protein